MNFEKLKRRLEKDEKVWVRQECPNYEIAYAFIQSFESITISVYHGQVIRAKCACYIKCKQNKHYECYFNSSEILSEERIKLIPKNILPKSIRNAIDKELEKELDLAKNRKAMWKSVMMDSEV